MPALNFLFPIQPNHKRFKGILLESQSYLDLQSELRSAEICADLQLRQGVLGLVAVPWFEEQRWNTRRAVRPHRDLGPAALICFQGDTGGGARSSGGHRATGGHRNTGGGARSSGGHRATGGHWNTGEGASSTDGDTSQKLQLGNDDSYQRLQKVLICRLLFSGKTVSESFKLIEKKKKRILLDGIYRHDSWWWCPVASSSLFVAFPLMEILLLPRSRQSTSHFLATTSSFCWSSGKRRTQLFLTISRLSSDYHSSAQKDGSLAIQLGDYVSWHHCPCYHQQCHQSHDDQHYNNNVEESSKREKYKMSLLFKASE